MHVRDQSVRGGDGPVKAHAGTLVRGTHEGINVGDRETLEQDRGQHAPEPVPLFCFLRRSSASEGQNLCTKYPATKATMMAPPSPAPMAIQRLVPREGFVRGMAVPLPAAEGFTDGSGTGDVLGYAMMAYSPLEQLVARRTRGSAL
jgi:hypothetical protein